MMLRRRFKIVIAMLAVIALLAAGVFVWRSDPVFNWRLDRAIAAHKAAPTQRTADSLVALLDTGRVATDEGNDILKILVTPIITTRSCYPTGEPVYFEVTRPFALRFRRLSGGGVLRCPNSDGAVARGEDHTPVTFGADNRFVRCAERFSEPGAHVLDYSEGYIVSQHDEGAWTWPDKMRSFPRSLIPRRRRPHMSWRADFLYQGAAEIPVTLRVVESDEAKRMETEADRAFDAEIRAALGEEP